MKELTIDDTIKKIIKNEFKYYNFYDADLSVEQYEAIQYYASNPNDDISVNQKLHIVFTDIECYLNGKEFNSSSYEHVINAISLYSNFENIYHSYVLLSSNHLKSINIKEKNIIEDKIKNELINDNYLCKDDNVIINFFTDELLMIKAWANKIKELDPAILSGFNSDTFDYPYIYFRLCKLSNNKNASKILSRFEIIKTRKFKDKTLIKIPEYEIIDILRLFKPRSEPTDPGLNYGKTLPSYSLSYVSNFVLKLTKFDDFKNEGLGIDYMYENDIINFIKYNIVDIILPKQINEKLRHIELHNLIRRDMKTPMSYSTKGPSMLFDTLFSYELNKKSKKFKYGIIKETSFKLSNNDINQCIKPKTNKIIWSIDKIDSDQSKQILNKFPGAYVKNSKNKLIDLNNGILIDLDATALYPSTMKQYNVSFETFHGRFIDPFCYKMLKYLESILGTENQYHPNLSNELFKYIDKYVEKIDSDKNENKQLYYYIISNMLNKLKKINKPIEKIFNPSTHNEYLILKLYLIPLLDLFTDIHPDFFEVNSFAYNYILNNKVISTEKYIYYINDITSPNIKIIKLENSVNNIEKFLKDNNLILTIAGTTFKKHDDNEQSILFKFLEDRLNMRTNYKKKMKEFKPEDDMYEYYNGRQNSMKINANSSYGLLGLGSFRFSNKFLAESVTLSGKLSLKIAQTCGEIYLRNMINEEQIK